MSTSEDEDVPLTKLQQNKESNDSISSISSTSSSEDSDINEDVISKKAKLKVVVSETVNDSEKPKVKSNGENECVNDDETVKLETPNNETENSKDVNNIKLLQEISQNVDKGKAGAEEKDGKVKKRKRSNDQAEHNKNKENRKIVNLKRYLNLCGYHVISYNKLFEGCKSMKSKETKLSDLLTVLGMEGRPTIQKCKRIRLRREEEKEVSELDCSNILQGRRRIVAKNTKPAKIQKYAFANMDGIVDSEMSSDAENTDKEKVMTNSRKKRRVCSSEEED